MTAGVFSLMACVLLKKSLTSDIPSFTITIAHRRGVPADVTTVKTPVNDLEK